MKTDKLEINNRKLDAATPVGAILKTDSKEARARYAAELAAHFQAYVDWAIGHWPDNQVALTPASFSLSRNELNAVCRQLGVPEQNSDADASAPGAAQFIPVTPMPWP